MEYFLFILALLSFSNASLRFRSDSDGPLPSFESENENFEVNNKSNLTTSDDDNFPYDTSLLWGSPMKASKSVRFDFTGTKEENRKPTFNYNSQVSPDSVAKNIDLPSFDGELFDEELAIHKVAIDLEWIKEYLIPCFKTGEMIPIERVKEVILIQFSKFFMHIFRLL